MKKQYIAAFLIGLLMPLLSIAQQPTKSSPELQVANGGQVSISSKEFKSAEVIGQAAGNHQALVLGDERASGKERAGCIIAVRCIPAGREMECARQVFLAPLCPDAAGFVCQIEQG